MKIKPVKAWAVVDEDRPEINVLDIYGHKDVVLEPGEKIISVIIRAE